MDDIKLAMLGNKEAAKRLTETGYFTASGDLSLDSCPFCGSSDVAYERYLHTARIQVEGCVYKLYGKY